MAKHVLNKTRNTTWTINSDNDVWILGEKGRIASDAASMSGILANNWIGKATIRVDGEINLTGSSSYGLSLDAGSGSVTIGKSGHVLADTAIYFASSTGPVVVSNHGALEAGDDGIYAYSPYGIRISNTGRIHGVNEGIQTDGNDTTIVNSGIIKAETGIYLDGGLLYGDPLDPAHAARIVNTGKVIGSDVSIYAGGLAVNIRNKGTLNGYVDLDNGFDVFNNRGGVLNGDLYGNFGNDVFMMAGGKINGVIYGGFGNDVVTLDSMAQVYVEHSNQGIDTVRINGTYPLGGNIENLTLLGKGNHTGIGNLQDNVITGNRGANTLYGQYGDDELRGGAGNDTLYGGDSDDRLDGQTGRDMLFGGEGDDGFVFMHGYGRDTIVDFEQGSDTILLYGFGDFAAIDDKIKYSGGDAVIDFGGGDVIVIRNILPSTPLTDTDFVFVS